MDNERQWITLSYTWNRGSGEENPLPSFEDLPFSEHGRVIGWGGGTEQWTFDVDIEFSSKELAERFEEAVLKLPRASEANTKIRYWDMREVNAAL